MKKNSKNSQNLKKVIKIKAQQLPLCCPMPDQAVWNKHPRVYLPIEEEIKVLCPYCGTQYELENKTHKTHKTSEHS